MTSSVSEVIQHVSNDEGQLSLSGGTNLTFVVNRLPKQRETSRYIMSWANALRAQETVTLSSNEMGSLNALKFEIVSARTVTGGQRKRFVAYTVMVRVLTDDHEDSQPAILERRYSEFHALYVALKRQYPAHFQSIDFPRKALVGNFTPAIITSRCQGFELFLDKIGSVTQLRQSTDVRNFMQKRELSDALKLILDEQYFEATFLVENCFRVMNKLHTDRSPSVLQNLCLLICLCKRLNDPRTSDLVGLAVRRYQGVSDADLLKYYVPLLNIAIDVSKNCGRPDSTSTLEDHVASLRQRGYAVNDSIPLLRLVLRDLLPEGCQAADHVDGGVDR